MSDSKLVEHATSEFNRLGWLDGEDEMQKEICENVIEILEVMSKQHHSESTLPYLMGVLEDCVSFKSIAPLTGEDSEWEDRTEMSGGQILFQNKRCSSVFKSEKGAFDVNGIVFIDNKGIPYTNTKKSCTKVEFPYSPKTIYMKDGLLTSINVFFKRMIGEIV